MANLDSTWVPGALVRLGDLCFVIAMEGTLELIDAPAPTSSPTLAPAFGNDLRVPGERVLFDTLEFIITADGTSARVRPHITPGAAGHTGYHVDSLAAAFMRMQLHDSTDQGSRMRRLALGLPGAPLLRAHHLSDVQHTREYLEAAAFSGVNAHVQLVVGEPGATAALEDPTPSTHLFGLSNAALIMCQALQERMTTVSASTELMGMADYEGGSFYDLLSDDETDLLSFDGSSEESHHPSDECFVAEENGDVRTATTPDEDMWTHATTPPPRRTRS